MEPLASHAELKLGVRQPLCWDRARLTGDCSEDFLYL